MINFSNPKIWKFLSRWPPYFRKMFLKGKLSEIENLIFNYFLFLKVKRNLRIKLKLSLRKPSFSSTFQPNQSTVHITPFKACLIDCMEVSTNYCSTPIPSIEYFADLYQLILSSIQPVSKSKTESMSPLLRQNVFELMKSIRPLSFC